MKGVTGRTAIVTGAGKGLGKGLALRLAEEGATVCICSRTQADVDALAREIANRGGEAIPLQCDVTDKAQVEALVRKAAERTGRIDICVNNTAKMTQPQPLEEQDVDFC